MSNLRFRKRGSYWEFSFEGARIAGKRQTISKSGFRTKAEASAAGAKAMAEYNRAGSVFTPSEISVSDYFDLLCPDDYASFVDADNGLKR